MRILATRPHAPSRAHDVDGPAVRVLRRVGRFARHLAEMCVVMCAGAVVLSVLFFGGAALVGYDDLPRSAPELSVLVIAVNLSVPMLLWMRFRGMGWRHTLEMSGSTMVVGLLLIAAYWSDVVARDSLVEIQTSLACPVMLAMMLFRFRVYSAGHSGSTTRHMRAR